MNEIVEISAQIQKHEEKILMAVVENTYNETLREEYKWLIGELEGILYDIEKMYLDNRLSIDLDLRSKTLKLRGHNDPSLIPIGFKTWEVLFDAVKKIIKLSRKAIKPNMDRTYVNVKMGQRRKVKS